MHVNVKQAQRWMYRNARPLEYALYQYHFEQGSKLSVLHCLSAFQNEDGGFAYALEADCWNEESSAIQTWKATKLLKELGYPKEANAMIQDILTYLENTLHMQKERWDAVIPSNENVPHAPWWDFIPERNRKDNPTASLAGFVLRFANPHKSFYKAVKEIAQHMMSQYLETGSCGSVPTLSCYLDLLEVIEEQGIVLQHVSECKERTIQELVGLLEEERPEWGRSYTCRPSSVMTSKKSIGYQELQEIIQAECTWLCETQKSDGTWEIDWEWEQHEEAWFISKQWWIADRIVGNLCFLQTFMK